MSKLKVGDLVILPQDGLCEVIAIDDMGATVRVLVKDNKEFRHPVSGAIEVNRSKQRQPFVISVNSVVPVLGEK